MTLAKQAYDVLNVVALKKMASLPVITLPTGLDEETVSSTLGELEGQGLVAVVGDAAMPTDAAGDALVASAAEHYEAARDDEAVQEAGDRFETLNRAFLSAMSAWQQVPMAGKSVANDHSDPDYDAKVVDTMAKLVGRLDAVLQPLSSHDARFTTYAARFEDALDRVDRGQPQFVSSPTIDSVHNIWFEFHEDLLRTLGRAREE